MRQAQSVPLNIPSRSTDRSTDHHIRQNQEALGHPLAVLELVAPLDLWEQNLSVILRCMDLFAWELLSI